MDQLYLRGEVRPFQRIFGVEDQEKIREPVIIPFRLQDNNSELKETKHEVLDPKQEVEDEEYSDNDLSEGSEEDDDKEYGGDGDNYLNGGSEEEDQKEGEVKKKNNKKAFCLQCNKGYKNSFTLKRHMKLHDIWVKKDEEKGKEPPELIACSDCSYKARNKDLMKRQENI